MADRHCLFLGGPLGQGSDDLLKSPLLDAIGAQYGKTPAQVALRWEADMKAIEPLNQKDTGFRDFADPNYLRRILGMFDLK